MLFALISDRIFFDTSPSLTSIIGSGLILGAAITMGVQKQSISKDSNEHEGEIATADEEHGLMERADVDQAEGGDRSSAQQEVQMRNIR